MEERMNIKVLGSGCKSCKKLLQNVENVTKELSSLIEVEYVTDMKMVVTYNVMQLPALIINDKVVSQGAVLSVKDIKRIIDEVNG